MAKSWSAQQKAIFGWFARKEHQDKKALAVRARAGTGKTTTIVEALSHAPEERILLAAFNKKIAAELAARISTPRAEAKTLHGLGFSYLRKFLASKQLPMVEIDQNAESLRIQKVLADAKVVAPDEAVDAIKDLISQVKNSYPHAGYNDIIGLAEGMVVEEKGWTAKRLAYLTDKALRLAAQGDGIISFDDMIWLPLIHDMVRPWYDLVVIDECQDMNASQILLARRACKSTGRIAVVGDDRQAIYGFRGADSGSLDRLKTELDAVELPLSVTYRCGSKIVDLAKKIVPDYQAADGAASGVINSCLEEQLVERAKPGDFILSRKNGPLMKICLQFLRAGVSCRVEGRDVGKQLAALVKKMRAASVAQFEAKVSAWGTRELAKATKKKDPKEAARIVEDQVETLLALADGAVTVDDIISRCTSLFEDSVDEEGRVNKKPAVVCSSVHKAKGLEADRVFILSYTFRPDATNIEEKNIEYVAITRAKSHLTWVSDESSENAPEYKPEAEAAPSDDDAVKIFVVDENGRRRV